jgi:hypothetical protein
MSTAIIVVLAIAYVGVLIWLANDVFDNMGLGGCVVVGIIYVVLAPLFPLLAIAYLLMRSSMNSSPSRTEREERVNQWNWRGAQTEGGQTGQRIPQISAAESDENIDVLLAQGKREEAMRLAKEQYDLATSFGDVNGAQRFKKYLDYIQRGGGLGGR